MNIPYDNNDVFNGTIFASTQKSVTPHTCENCKWFVVYYDDDDSGECGNMNNPVIDRVNRQEAKVFGCNQWGARDDNG